MGSYAILPAEGESGPTHPFYELIKGQGRDSIYHFLQLVLARVRIQGKENLNKDLGISKLQFSAILP